MRRVSSNHFHKPGELCNPVTPAFFINIKITLW